MSETVETPEAGEQAPAAPGQESAPGVEETAGEQRGTSSGAADQSAELERLRKELEAARPILAAHQEAEEARKSEADKLREALEAAKADAADKARALTLREVAEETALPSSLVAKLPGGSRDELLALAKEIQALVGESPRGGKLPSRPTPKLRTGHDAPDPGETLDPRKLAAIARKLGRF
ncbi:hypothetical protein [Streptomyces sp. SID14515]|uniref:hypothetical protein n=1 Tax=Streptomyces sp. SID14515 TaxID=2706074 RepID=UPI0013C596D8|nr:hypothetical protein [Streptomyces sp. SID14515]NEB35866.1 hypothetical protein [Streptomyces sp. SID14515]